MSNILASILVNIDTRGGTGAIDYTPGSTGSAILGFNCIRSEGNGSIKITAIRSTVCNIEGDGTGARLRITTGGAGDIKTVEVACGGSGYENGKVSVSLIDPFGGNGEIYCTATNGIITSATIVSPGIGYSGYIEYDINDFIEGVTYNIIPRYVEQTSGSGSLKLAGYKVGHHSYNTF